MYLVLLALLVVIASYIFFTTRRRERCLKKLVNVKTGEPMPGLSFFGSLWDILVVRRQVGIAESALQLTKKFGPVYRGILFDPTVTCAEPAILKRVLKKIEEFPKQDVEQNRFKHIEKFTGFRNILNLNQPEWHDQRSVLNKAFTSNKVFFEPMLKKVHQVTSLWKNNEPVHVSYDLQKMTLDVLATCIFGYDFDTLNGQNAGPLAAYNYCFENLFSPFRFVFPWYNSLPIPANFKVNQQSTIFDEYCWKIINQAKNSRATDQTETDKLPSLISLMLESGMSDKDVRDNVSIFFLAGHETTASTLSWVLGLLASHPEIQKKAREEVFQKAPNGLTYDVLKDFEYIDCIIHEVMRMYPAAPLIGGRKCTTDVVLGDWFIPAQTVVQIDLITMLYDKKIWGDPEIFRPERWAPENLTKEQRSTWMPFSYGPRICIGMNFSLVEQKIFIATVLREFSEVKFANGAKLCNGASLLNVPDGEKLVIQFVK